MKDIKTLLLDDIAQFCNVHQVSYYVSSSFVVASGLIIAFFKDGSYYNETTNINKRVYFNLSDPHIIEKLKKMILLRKTTEGAISIDGRYIDI